MSPRLVVITDWALPRERLLWALQEVCALGPEVAVQHRAPAMGGRRFLEEARVLARLVRPSGTHLFVNGRLDVALLVEAHLHLPASGLTVADARAHLPAGRLVSVAVHDAAEAHAAAGADFALVSPVYAPGSKPGDTRPQLGPQGFEALSRALPCPAFALGGMDVGRAEGLGAAGVAVVSAVLAAERPREVASRLLSATRASGPS